jgi:hypothetical protein
MPQYTANYQNSKSQPIKRLCIFVLLLLGCCDKGKAALELALAAAFLILGKLHYLQRISLIKGYLQAALPSEHFCRGHKVEIQLKAGLIERH